MKYVIVASPHRRNRWIIGRLKAGSTTSFMPVAEALTEDHAVRIAEALSVTDAMHVFEVPQPASQPRKLRARAA